MGILVENPIFSLRLSLTALRFTGFWPPESWCKGKLVLYYCYGSFCFMFLLGIFLITEVADLFLIWGNLPLMTGTAFLLFTNLAQAAKLLNIIIRRKSILKIIKGCEVLKKQKSKDSRNIVESCNRETRQQQVFFFILTTFTVAGWLGSAETGKLPLRAWYPYNTNISPVYEITYIQQGFTIFLAALLNVSKDTLVTSLIALCKCRLRLIGLSLRNICEYCHYNENATPDTYSQGTELRDEPLTSFQELKAYQHIRRCVIEHQRTLNTILLIEKTFSEPTFAQFSVSLVIICATAFQLVSQSNNYVRFISMGTYLLNMMFQVFIYCDQGHSLSIEEVFACVSVSTSLFTSLPERENENIYNTTCFTNDLNHLFYKSEDLSTSVYGMPWYSYSVRVRRSLLVIMVRCRRTAKLTAGGFTTLSITSFMAIIKMSYSLFTLLRQVTE